MDTNLTKKPTNLEMAIVRSVLKKVSNACEDNHFRDLDTATKQMHIDDMAKIIGSPEVRFTQESVEKFSGKKFKSRADFEKNLNSLRGEFLEVHQKDKGYIVSHSFFVGELIKPMEDGKTYAAKVGGHVMAKLLGFGRDNFINMPICEKSIDDMDGRTYRLMMEMLWVVGSSESEKTKRKIENLRGLFGARGKVHQEYKHLNDKILKGCVQKINDSGWLEVSYSPITSTGQKATKGNKATSVSFHVKKTAKFLEFESLTRKMRDSHKAEYNK